MARHGRFAAGGLAGGFAHRRAAPRRVLGLLISNALWVCWGWQDAAWALIVLNVCLALMNVRGIVKNERA